MNRARRGQDLFPDKVDTPVSGEIQIGKEFGMTRYSSVSSAVNRIKKKRQNDGKFLKRVNALMALAKKGQTKI